MGDNLHLGDRDGVRTPMQWTPDRNGGFSRADPAALILPPIMDPIYGYEAVNVEAQWRDAHSLLNWVRRMLVVRSRHKVFGRGGLRFLRPQNRKVLAYLREYEDETILCVVNLSRTAQAVELELAEFAGRTPVEMLGGVAFPLIGQLSYLLTLPPYAFYWFYISASAEPPSWSTASPGPLIELHTFVLRDGVAEIVETSARDVLEKDILPKYIAQRRWFQGKGAEIKTAQIVAACTASPGEVDFLFADVKVASEGAADIYALPLAIAWEDMAAAPFEAPLALARVRRRSRVGYLSDGFVSLKFVRAILDGLANRARLPFGNDELVFAPAAGFDIAFQPDIQVDWLGAEQSNSSLIIGRAAVVKLFRRAATGIHPEAEMIRCLTGRGFTGIAALLGEVTRVAASGAQSLLAIVQRFVANQGNGFQWTVDQLKRLLAEHSSEVEHDGNRFTSYENFASRLGTRLGEMHLVLAQPSTNPAFAPEIVDLETLMEWTERARVQIETAFSILAESARVREGVRTPAVERLARRRSAILHAVEDALRRSQGTFKTRIHGDLHLGQVLVAAGDVVFMDFEGEPLKSVEERRAKASPLRDVAGMLRSFDYAARIAGREARNLEGELGEERSRVLLAQFRHIAAVAFLRGYEHARGATLDAREKALIAAFGVEKAAYEIVYEATNRPDWIAVPIEGFVEMAEQLIGSPE
jgi:maltose alpha-D-glucosyltransferase/alpha-amylase